MFFDSKYQFKLWLKFWSLFCCLPSRVTATSGASPLVSIVLLHSENKITSFLKSTQKQELPSAALGWLGGGDIAVSQSDQSGTKTKESFFEVKANIENDKNINFYHGRSGILKVKLEPKTLIDRLVISLNQILQKHYKI